MFKRFITNPGVQNFGKQLFKEVDVAELRPASVVRKQQRARSSVAKN